jgi:hypothetical protein
MCEVKNKITEHIFDTHDKPKNYDFLKDLYLLVQQVGHRKLKLDFSGVARNCTKFSKRNKLKSIRNSSPYIRYNIFGSKTGRLTAVKNSFPILTMDKVFRGGILPTNDRFIEFDYNAFELRVLLYLLDKEQPQIDIHTWNVDNVYRGLSSREKAKKRIFSWLYNPESNDYLSERVYDREGVLKKYWNGTSVANPFGREIEADRFHAISYLIQSTAVDIVLRQMLKVNSLLDGRRSYIAFTIHDSVVIDLAEEDLELVPALKKRFSMFRNTEFLTNISIGKDFGNMRQL